MTKYSESAILDRVLHPKTDRIARAILDLRFDKLDEDRMRTLLQKNQDGLLTEEEQEELETYRRIGYFLDLLRSKARRSSLL